MQDFGANALADVSNIALHFLHPFTKHDHSCLCLLCSVQERQEQKLQSKKRQAASLVALPTSNDLDLIKTGSKSIRQLIVYDDQSSTHLRQFVIQLQSYIGYKVIYNATPNVETSTSAPFHVLVILARSLLPASAKTWLRHVYTNHLAKRIVVIQTNTEEDILSPSPKLTCIRHTNYEVTLKTMVHAMMFTKQRLMPKDLARFLTTDVADVRAPQQGCCLFF